MPDPYVSLRSFQRALRCGRIDPIQAKLHPELLELVDREPVAGELRMTFALMDGRTVKAIVIFGDPSRSAGHELSIQTGYAVAPSYRNQGLAKRMLQMCIDEFLDRVRDDPDTDTLIVKAIIDRNNFASQKVAKHVLSSNPREMVDGRSGTPAFEYARVFQAKSN